MKDSSKDLSYDNYVPLVSNVITEIARSMEPRCMVCMLRCLIMFLHIYMRKPSTSLKYGPMYGNYVVKQYKEPIAATRASG